MDWWRYVRFYHSEKLQSTKTNVNRKLIQLLFYHSEKLQSTKTYSDVIRAVEEFYHSEKLQSTKPSTTKLSTFISFRYNRTANKKSTDHKTCAQNSTQKNISNMYY